MALLSFTGSGTATSTGGTVGDGHWGSSNGWTHSCNMSVTSTVLDIQLPDVYKTLYITSSTSNLTITLTDSRLVIALTDSGSQSGDSRYGDQTVTKTYSYDVLVSS